MKELVQRLQDRFDRLEDRIQELEKTGSVSAQQAVKEIESLQSKITELENFKNDLSGRITATTVGLGVVFTLIQIGLHFWK